MIINNNFCICSFTCLVHGAKSPFISSILHTLQTLFNETTTATTIQRAWQVQDIRGLQGFRLILTALWGKYYYHSYLLQTSKLSPTASGRPSLISKLLDVHATVLILTCFKRQSTERNSIHKGNFSYTIGCYQFCSMCITFMEMKVNIIELG